MSDQNADDLLGPVDYFVLEFPDGRPSAGGFATLQSLNDQDVICVIDVQFIAKRDSGLVELVDAADVTADGVDLSEWAGASSALLDDEDVAAIGEAMAPGAISMVVVFENRWVIGLVDDWRRAGARLLFDGGVPPADLVAALDATEPT